MNGLPPSDLYVVYSISNSPYQEWQARVLDFSAGVAGQPGTIVRICSQDSNHPRRPVPAFEHGYTFATPCFSSLGGRVVGPMVRWAKRRLGLATVGRFHFPCLNKPFGMRAFLAAHDLDDDARLLWLDPDMIFHRPWLPPLGSTKRGNVCGQRWWGFDDHWFRSALSETERRAIPAAESAIMFPFCMRVSDMWRMIDDFCELTLRIHRRTRDWKSEMAALVVSMGRAGLTTHTVPSLAPCNNWPDGLANDASAPMAHYTQTMFDRDGRKIWDKREYTPSTARTPWERPPAPSVPSTRVDRRALRMLHDFIEARSAHRGSEPLAPAPSAAAPSPALDPPTRPPEPS